MDMFVIFFGAGSLIAGTGMLITNYVIMRKVTKLARGWEKARRSLRDLITED